MLTHVHNYHNGRLFFGLHFCVGDPVVWLLHMPISVQTSRHTTLAILPVIPSPPTHDTLSLHRLCIQGDHSILPIFSSLHQPSPSKEQCERDGGIIRIVYFWDHHTPIQIVAKPTEALDTTIVVAIGKHIVLKPEVCRKPGSGSLQLKPSAS